MQAEISTMRTLVLVLTLTFIVKVNTLTLPDIFWDPRNPLFDSEKCGHQSRKFYAKINDNFNILCGNRKLNIGFLSRKHTSTFDYFYNVYYTDNDSVYTERNGSAAKLVQTCRESLVEKTAGFYSPVVVKEEVSLSLYPFKSFPGFEAGKKYWFFTTSNGSKSSLKNKFGDKNSMGFEIDICPETSSCKGRGRTQLCMGEEETKGKNNIVTPTSSMGKIVGNGTPSSSIMSKNMLIITLTLAVLLGILIGVLVMVLKQKCFNKDQRFTPSVVREKDDLKPVINNNTYTEVDVEDQMQPMYSV